MTQPYRPKASVSNHAAQRAAQRLPVSNTARLHTVALFEMLWRRGRPATWADFLQFRTVRMSDALEYRVCVHRAGVFLVVFNPITGRFVTLIKRDAHHDQHP